MELETEPTFQQITWVIRDFVKLPQKKKFFVGSPEFLFCGGRYSMRLYPNWDKDKTAIHVRELSVSSCKRKFLCKVGLRTREGNGAECYDYCPWSLQEKCFKSSMYSRSWIENNRDEYVPNGSLTVVCCMRLSAVSTAGSSAQGEEEQGRFPGHSASFSSTRSPAKTKLTTQFPCTLVQWTARNVFELVTKTDDSFTSPEFRFAGYTYYFRFQANGDTGDTDLQLVRLTSTFPENAVCYRVGYRRFYPTYSNKSRSLVGNVGLCVSRSKLEEERDKYVPYGGMLRLVLFLRLGEQSSAGAGTSEVAQKETGLTDIENLQSDYRRLLHKETESDTCFVVRGKEFRVHRNVLRARSTVFEAMFGHDTAEKESGRVVVDDLDPDTFGDFLEYLYAGNVGSGLSDDNAFGLYMAADKYDLSTLKSKCVEHMRRTLSVNSFCDFLSLALRHREEDLFQQAIKFFKDNLKRIIITAKWQQFNINNSATANELLIKALVPGKQ